VCGSVPACRSIEKAGSATVAQPASPTGQDRIPAEHLYLVNIPSSPTSASSVTGLRRVASEPVRDRSATLDGSGRLRLTPSEVRNDIAGNAGWLLIRFCGILSAWPAIQHSPLWNPEPEPLQSLPFVAGDVRSWSRFILDSGRALGSRSISMQWSGRSEIKRMSGSAKHSSCLGVVSALALAVDR